MRTHSSLAEIHGQKRDGLSSKRRASQTPILAGTAALCLAARLSRRARWLGIVLVLTSRAATGSGPPLAVSADATFTPAVRAVVTAENVGSAPLDDVTAEIRYRLVER